MMIGSVHAEELGWPPFKAGEGPCLDLDRSTVAPNNPALVMRRVLEPVSVTPIREVVTDTASGKITLPICTWKSEEWTQHAIGTVVLHLHAQTASAIALTIGPGIIVGVPMTKGHPNQNFVTLEAITLHKGTKEVRVHIMARDSGALGLVKAGAITVLNSNPMGITSVRNDQPTVLPDSK